MIVLGIDTATPSTSVALLSRGHPTLEARDDPPPGERPRHCTHLLPLISDLLERAALSWGSLERIAVGIGPGTFTGLRIGIASARAIAQALGAELVGVPTLAALAQSAFDAPEGALPPDGPAPGVCLAVLDARRGEAFAAAYVSESDPPRARKLAPAGTFTPDALQRYGEELAALAERSAQGAPIAVGDGALRFRAQLELSGMRVHGEGSPLHLVKAASICELATRAEVEARDEVLPLYVRRPDAEIALEAGKR